MVKASRTLRRSVLAAVLLTSRAACQGTVPPVTLRAEGVVVAIQGEEGGRLFWQPGQLADLVEVFIARIYKWPRKGQPDLIVIGYTFYEPPIEDEEFDRTIWRFELRMPPPNDLGGCSKDWVTLGRSAPTAFGRHLKLPKPETLPCYVMEKRPVAVRHLRTTSK